MWVAACLALLLQLQDPPLQPAWTADFEDIILGTPTAHGISSSPLPRTARSGAFKADTGVPAWWFDAKLYVPRISSCSRTGFSCREPSVDAPRSGDGKVLRDELPGASRVIAGASRLYLLESLRWDADRMFYGSSLTVTSFDPVTGKAPWRRSFPIPARRRPSRRAGRCTSRRTAALALDAGTGKQAGEAHNFSVASPYNGVADKERLFLLMNGPRGVLCLNRTTLKEQWAVTVKGSVRPIPRSSCRTA
jgi:outer membrane protein assembly factor BamB